jgi:NADPH-dependent glutamate synthase beta subunit-like oxidoreductase
MIHHEILPPERIHTLAIPVHTGDRPLFPWEKTGDWRTQRPVHHLATAPCSVGCPAGTRIRDAIALAMVGRQDDAWKVFKEANPFPAITGRVCYHPCEAECSRGTFDDPVVIHSIERALGDYGLERGLKMPPHQPTGKHVAVVGSGPAGLSAAYYLTLNGHNVTVYESAAQIGGMLRFGIPHYRLPVSVLDAELEGLQTMGIQFLPNTPIETEEQWRTLSEYDAVFLAIGCQLSMRLNVPGIRNSGVIDGLSFLNQVNAGSADHLPERIVVIGGGNVAIDAARCAVRCGAKNVRLVCLESLEEMPASYEERQQAQAEGIEIMPGRSVRSIVDDHGQARGVQCIEIDSFSFGPGGELHIEAVPGSEHVLKADAVITCIGIKADTSSLPAELDLDKAQLLTGMPVHFGEGWMVACGDVVSGPTRVADAIASGRITSRRIDALLANQSFEDEMSSVPFDPESLNIACFATIPRQNPIERSPKERVLDFNEIEVPISEDAMVAEMERCLYCGDCNLCSNCWAFCPDLAVNITSGESDGTYTMLKGEHMDINYEVCKGCGICARECPRGAIAMEKEEK